MNQRKKNIQLLYILGGLLAITTVVILMSGDDDALDVPRNLFSYPSTESVDEVLIGEDTLNFNGNFWVVNNKYKADPQRVEVLFAIARQIQVRRQASMVQQDSLNTNLDTKGVSLALKSQGQTMKEYTVWGDPARGMTWLREPGSNMPYLAEIPGYRSYLGGIFELDENSWRYPIVLDINWQNLQQVAVSYPGKEQSSFEVVYENGFYGVSGLEATDSTRLTDFLDNLSLLYVNDYLSSSEVAQYDSLFSQQEAHIVVSDVGQNEYVVDIFEKVPGRDEILIRIDSSRVGLVDYGKVRTLLKPRVFFRQQ